MSSIIKPGMDEREAAAARRAAQPHLGLPDEVVLTEGLGQLVMWWRHERSYLPAGRSA
jgi:hypothetical protein